MWLCTTYSTIFASTTTIIVSATTFPPPNMSEIIWWEKIICTSFTPWSEQITDILSKDILPKYFSILCDKLCMINIYASL